MKEFKDAELEVILFEDDVIVTSGSSCTKVFCPANSCQCNQNIVCEGQQ